MCTDRRCTKHLTGIFTSNSCSISSENYYLCSAEETARVAQPEVGRRGLKLGVPHAPGVETCKTHIKRLAPGLTALGNLLCLSCHLSKFPPSVLFQVEFSFLLWFSPRVALGATQLHIVTFIYYSVLPNSNVNSMKTRI